MITLTDIRNQIIQLLLDESLFLLEKDLGKIKLPEELESEKADIVIAAMKNLENAKIVEQVNKNGTLSGWILQNPLEEYPQTVTISGGIAGEIANLINTFVESHDEDGQKKPPCNRFNLKEEDLMALVAITQDVLSHMAEEDDDDKE